MPMRQQLVALVRQKRTQLAQAGQEGCMDLLLLFGDLDANCGRVGTLQRLVQLAHTQQDATRYSSWVVERCMLHTTVTADGGTLLAIWPRLVAAQLARMAGNELLWIVLDMRRADAATQREWMGVVHRMVQDRVVSGGEDTLRFPLHASTRVQVVLVFSTTSAQPQPVPVTHSSGMTLASSWSETKRAHYQREALTHALSSTLDAAGDDDADVHLQTTTGSIMAWLCRPLLPQDRLKAVEQLVYASFPSRAVDAVVIDVLLQMWNECSVKSSSPSSIASVGSSAFDIHLADLQRVLDSLLQDPACVYLVPDRDQLPLQHPQVSLSRAVLASTTELLARAKRAIVEGRHLVSARQDALHVLCALGRTRVWTSPFSSCFVCDVCAMM